MSNFLLVREKIREPGDLALLEHQAIAAIARTILAAPDNEGTKLSEHRLLAPAHPDILTILALAADDFSLLIEPESYQPSWRPPISLYWDGSIEDEETANLIEQFLHPRWFNIGGSHPQENRSTFLKGKPNLIDIVSEFKPEVCILTGDASGVIDKLMNLNSIFQLVVGFSLFLRDTEDKLRNMQIGETITMADQVFDEAIRYAMKSMNISAFRPEQGGFWFSLYQNGERRPELEPFIAFGAALETVIFPQRFNSFG
ncbi:hypothetical protein V9K67_09100 [Paraflavisolibacter sp. H34]|uniref:hypothetical protein n=1 Tax=Huijunlia imazamoxiresistens TaxID=3127457 RepID=UPI003015F03C